MRILTAAEASRQFSQLLDAIERGETVMVTRGGRAIAEFRPAPEHTWESLKVELQRLEADPSDDDSQVILDETRALLTPGSDLWSEE
ncbi:Antitoxin component of toxin-antitoxin stability system, DNA-binding transcriptional repressor [Micrococcales bacterium KH10]|nr:Antitoxin component of toxin-antitoxin stability system, DNA-binding transcriptional repressor [Micrococcales bacterium KH10]